MKKTIVILENIRSAHNVGAIFRTADGAGVSEIFLVGYTPCPIDRFGRVQPEIEKTSLGASSFIPWKFFENTEKLMEYLNKEDVYCIAIEQTDKRFSYKDEYKEVDTAFIFGNEVEGVSKELLNTADEIREIPMSGQKESLNVSTTAGIILFHHRDQSI